MPALEPRRNSEERSDEESLRPPWLESKSKTIREIPRIARDGGVTGPFARNGSTRYASWGAPRSEAPHGAATLAEASRQRLARPVLDPELWKEYEKATGEPVDPANPPTWAELIAAQEARRAATSENGTREAKELRDAAEGAQGDASRVALLISLDGLPKTNAVAGA